jgi:hypothetical protein
MELSGGVDSFRDLYQKLLTIVVRHLTTPDGMQKATTMIEQFRSNIASRVSILPL